MQVFIQYILPYLVTFWLLSFHTDRTIDEPGDSQDFLFYQKEQSKEIHIVRYPKAYKEPKVWKVVCFV